MEDRWRNKNATLYRLDWFSAGVNSRALLQTNVDVLIDSVELRTVDNGSHCRRRVVSVARHNRFGNLAHLFQQLIFDLLIDNHACTCMAGLAGVVEHSPRNCRCRGINVWAVGKNDVRCLATKLERNCLRVAFCRILQEVLAHFCGASERQLVDVHVFAKGAAAAWAEAVNHVEHTSRHARLHSKLGKQERRKRRLFCWLQDDGVAAGESRANLPGRNDERVVPGHNCTDDTHWFALNKSDAVARDRRNLAIQLVDCFCVPLNVVGARHDINIE